MLQYPKNNGKPRLCDAIAPPPQTTLTELYKNRLQWKLLVSITTQPYPPFGNSPLVLLVCVIGHSWSCDGGVVSVIGPFMSSLPLRGGH